MRKSNSGTTISTHSWSQEAVDEVEEEMPSSIEGQQQLLGGRESRATRGFVIRLSQIVLENDQKFNIKLRFNNLGIVK